jgi:uncharacterized protein YxjI
MHPVLNQNLFLVKEHVGAFKASNNFDIYDPNTGQPLMHCREENLGLLTKLFRFSDYKRMTPFDVQVRTPDGQPLVRVTRGISVLLSKVKVLDENNQPLGGFNQKLFSIGGAFTVVDEQDQPMCMLKGKWSGWDFHFTTPDGAQLAHVTKQWAGVGKELFTTADNYMLQIADDVEPDDPIRQLILGSVMCIDFVLKE